MITAIHVKLGIARTTGTQRFALVHKLGRHGWVQVVLNLIPGRFGFTPWVTWAVYTDSTQIQEATR